MPNLHITSETGRLRSVMLHRPGPEVDHMTPEMRDELLFDEILWLPGAREEHDVFAAILELGAGRGTVLYVEDLLEDVLADEGLRQKLVLEVTALEPGYEDDRQALARELLELDPPRLVTALVAGQPEDAPHSLGEFLEDRTLYRPQPVPNLLFMRDTSAVVGSRALVCSMNRQARRREPLLLRYVFRHHPLFASQDGEGATWWDPYEEHPDSYPDAHIEGGDVIVLNDHALLIGCSERTDHQGIDTFARRLLQEKSSIRTLYVVLLPPRRAWMHLDTVFTFLSPEECVLYPALFHGYGDEGVRIIEMSLQAGGVRVREHSAFLPDLLRRQEGMHLHVYECGGRERLRQDREQWTDAANFFALAPGVVVGYERNEVTFDALRTQGGYDVVSIEDRLLPGTAGDARYLVDGEPATAAELSARIAIGSGRKVAVRVPGRELSRARGGPRCMTLPLLRDEL